MSGFQLTYKQFGERSILVEWPPEISEKVLYDVIAFKNVLINSSVKSIVEVKSAYNSILINYELAIDNVNDSVLTLKGLYAPSNFKKN